MFVSLVLYYPSPDDSSPRDLSSPILDPGRSGTDPSDPESLPVCGGEDPSLLRMSLRVHLIPPVTSDVCTNLLETGVRPP